MIELPKYLTNGILIMNCVKNGHCGPMT